jgi:hypothetical protein
MTLFLIQLGLDAIAVGAFVVWMTTRKARAALQSAETTEEFNRISSRFKEMENEMLRYRDKMEVQLTVLKKVCDEAARIVARSHMLEFSSEPTIEETELKSAAQSNREQIPTLKQIEKTRGRLEGEIRVDLRSLLRDQLV